MPTITLSIQIDPALIPDGDVIPLMEALSDFAPVLEEIGDLMGQTQQENFASQGAKFGDPWRPLSASTLREKARLGYPSIPLVRTGALRDALGQTVEMGANDVTAGVDLASVPYASYHQAGTSRMPARILVAISPSEKDEIEQLLTDYLASRTGETVSGVTITAQEDDD